MNRLSGVFFPTGRLLSIALLLGPIGLGAQGTTRSVSGGDGTIYAGAYDGFINVIDEATFEIIDKIETRSGLPGWFKMSHDRERLYVLALSGHFVDIIDRREGRSIDSFTLDSGNAEFRIGRIEVDPQEEYMIVVGKRAIKHPDRFEVSPNLILRYDLARHEVTDTIAWPDGQERYGYFSGANLMFSPDGELLYFFADDIIALETENFTEVDRWEISRPIESGLPRVRWGANANYYDDPGFFTGLFRVTDPINNRRMMGIARVNLAAKEVDFYTLGPAESVGALALAPGGKRAYALYDEIGRYEFWTFDLENRRVLQRQEFAGRPRMGLVVSTNGELLYVHVAGHTIDVYDANSYEYLKTVEVGGDMTDFHLVPASDDP